MSEVSSGIWVRDVWNFCHLNPPLNDAAKSVRQPKTTKNMFFFACVAGNGEMLVFSLSFLTMFYNFQQREFVASQTRVMLRASALVIFPIVSERVTPR